MSVDDVLEFWAKKTDSETHYPLIYHMLDVAAVVQQLWDKSLHASARDFVSKEIGLPHIEAKNCVSLWAGLHDIGKASPGFQARSESVKRELLTRGYRFSAESGRHDVITCHLLRTMLHNGPWACLADRLATTLGGHHGVFPRSIDVQNARSDAGKGRWYDEGVM